MASFMLNVLLVLRVHELVGVFSVASVQHVEANFRRLQNMVFSVLGWVCFLTREALRCQRCVMSVALGCDFLRLAP